MANEIQEFRFNLGYKFPDVVEKTVSDTAAGDIVVRFKRASTISTGDFDVAMQEIKDAYLKTKYPFSSIP